MKKEYYKVFVETCDYAKVKRVELILKPHSGTNATGHSAKNILKR